MKKYIMLLAVIALGKLAYSQTEKVILDGSAKINRKSTPGQVIDSFTRIFPDAKSIKYYRTPADIAVKGWSVVKQQDLQPGGPGDYYTISFKKSKIQYYGLFASDGGLVKTRMRQKVTDLPGPIRESLKTLDQVFPGYRVVSGTYYKSIDPIKGQKEHYEVLVQKGWESMILIYEDNGKLLNAK